MSNHYSLLNPAIGLARGKRRWVQLGGDIQVTPRRVFRLMRDRIDDQDCPVFHDIGPLNTAVYPIRDEHWFCRNTPDGFIEIIPKAFKFDDSGRVDAVLVELLNTPAEFALN